MEPVFYIMAILGCGEADTACQQVAVAEQRYESAEACNRATAEMIERNAGVEFPVVVAQCKPEGQMLGAEIMPADISLPEGEQQPKLRRAVYSTGPARG